MKNRIASLRKKRGLSQDELADAVGSTRNMVGKLERGDRRINSDWLQRLASALDCAPEDIMGGDVPIVGRIGAGGSVVYEDIGLDETISRPPDTMGRLVALEVEGEDTCPIRA